MIDAPFRRPRHQAIAHVLHALDGDLLRRHHCLFGGGTAIAMRYGEFRESVDIDLLVSQREGFRDLRQLARRGLATIFRDGRLPFRLLREPRIDQYGVRTSLEVVGMAVKFEIVREARIELDVPRQENTICGVTTLSALDMATEKLLANSDRWLDDGAFNRDLIDLAMMQAPKKLMETALAKARMAYGEAVPGDLQKAIDRLENRSGWLERCMTALAMEMPKAVLWKHVRKLKAYAS